MFSSSQTKLFSFFDQCEVNQTPFSFSPSQQPINSNNIIFYCFFDGIRLSKHLLTIDKARPKNRRPKKYPVGNGNHLC